MTYRILTLGTCIWIKATMPGLRPRKLKRSVAGSSARLGTTVEYQYPLLKLMPDTFLKESKAIIRGIKGKIGHRSVATPWGAHIRYVPNGLMEALMHDVGPDVQDFQALTSKVLGAWDTVWAEALKELAVLAEREYAVADPFGFTSKAAWTQEYIEDMTAGFPGKEEVEEDMCVRLVVGDLRPAPACPPGCHTVGRAAMEAWAEDYVMETLAPLQESLMHLRRCCTESDPAKALEARRLAHLFPVRADRAAAWDTHHDSTLKTATAECLRYFMVVKDHIMTPRNEDVRRNMAALALTPLLILADRNKTQERINYLLEEV